ncbi:MAG: DUF5615 family PIN-like protein [Myxococcota bacterium]
MKILIDESLPRDLKKHFPGHSVATVPECGWASKSNGALLAVAAADFDAFLTADQNLEHQQNLANYDIGIIVLVARSNRIADLLPLIPRAIATILAIRPGVVVRVA